MRIGRRLFPYPLLNNNSNFSQYKKSTFSMDCGDILVQEDEYILKDIHYSLKNDYIKGLLDSGKAKVLCLIECPETMVRKTYEITDKPSDIVIPLFDLSGKLTVSSFVIATEDIDDYRCDDFNDDYEGFNFYVEKNDILAVDDGFYDKVTFEGVEDDKKSSIFLVVKDQQSKDGIMKVDCNNIDKIIITLPEEQWNRYDKTKSLREFRSLYLSVIAIPALTFALDSLQKRNDSVDVLEMDYNWFNSFAKSYEKQFNRELTDDLFKDMNTYSVSQAILNASVTKSVDDLFGFAMSGLGGGEDVD